MVTCFFGVFYDRSAISTNKAAILKAVGSKNEAAATKLLADLDLGLGEPIGQASYCSHLDAALVGCDACIGSKVGVPEKSSMLSFLPPLVWWLVAVGVPL